MLNFLLAAHIVVAVFAIGPLVHAATTAARGVRTGDGAATASAARTLRIYMYASVLVVIIGMGLLSQKEDGQKVGKIGETWVWLSLALWAVAVVIVLTVIVPTLNRATALITAQESVVALTARVAASGGVVALAMVTIVVLMVYRPGH